MQKTKSRVLSVLTPILLIVVGISIFRIASAEEKRMINSNPHDPVWGNEREFLRLFKVEEGDMQLHASSLASDAFTFTDEGIYSFVTLCHNASEEELKDVCLHLSYPDCMRYGKPNIATATIEWRTANGETGSAVSDIVLEPAEDMAMQARDVYIVVNDVAGNAVPFDRQVSIVSGTVTQDIYLGALPAGEIGSYTIFVASHVRSII